MAENNLHQKSIDVAGTDQASIKHLSRQAKKLSALLSVIDMLEPDHQFDTLCTCASIAEELAENVAALTRGAA